METNSFEKSKEIIATIVKYCDNKEIEEIKNLLNNFKTPEIKGYQVYMYDEQCRIKKDLRIAKSLLESSIELFKNDNDLIHFKATKL